ncbi:hypothetical protein [Pseudonocardia acaciae]|uniref:hypothetical protein n=1 Tax=Pseudonocardia acaciae TaxID=551276 RepID=UPI000AABB008|nr:hypothetical protein [Pseudonocardia acaciae]
MPLAALRDAGVASLVIRGTWRDPELYRRNVGEALVACADAVADALGARLLAVPGYYPHTQRPAEVNAALRELWGQPR